jgi:hypothetical protein
MTAAKEVARSLFEKASATKQNKKIDAWLKHHLNHYPFHPNSRRASKIRCEQLRHGGDDGSW